MACLNPLRTYFLVIFSLDPNNGITARRFAWKSPEEKFVTYNVVACLGKTTMSSFRQVGTAFFGDSRRPGPFCSSGATLARFFQVEIF